MLQCAVNILPTKMILVTHVQSANIEIFNFFEETGLQDCPDKACFIVFEGKKKVNTHLGGMIFTV